MSDLQKVTRLIEDRLDQLTAAVPARLQPLIAEALLAIAQAQRAQKTAQAGCRMTPAESWEKHAS